MWQKIQDLAKILAAVAVPVVVALVGYWIQTSIKQAEISAKMVELAIGILQQEPADPEGGTSALRDYGIDLLEHYSAVPVTPALRMELQQTPLPVVSLNGPNSIVVNPTTWGSQPWGSSPVGGPSASPDPEE